MLLRRLPGVDAHRVLDEALAGVRVDHPHLARVLDAGLDASGVPWLARDEAEDAWQTPGTWSDWRDRLREALGALQALEAAGLTHGRVHRGNLRLEDGRLLLVDASGTGGIDDDLVGLAEAFGPPPPGAPEGAERWQRELAARAFLRVGDAIDALVAIDPGHPTTLPARLPVGHGLLAVRPPPLVGRDPELARLAEATEASPRRAQVVIVSSPPGLGGSRLLEEAARRAHLLGGHHVFRDALLPTGPAASSTDPDAARSDVGRHARLRHLFRQRSGARTPLVVLEDAHLHPQHLPFARSWLARATPGLLLVDLDANALAESPGLQEAVAELEASGAAHLVLEPLSDEDLVASLTSFLPDEEGIARSAAVLSEGNPMAAHHALVSLVHTSEFPLDASPWWAWMDLVLDHVDDQRHLEVAAVLDSPIDPVEWARTGTSLGLRWSRRLPYLLRLHGLAHRSQGTWRLAHADLRATLQQRCRDEGRWAEVHRACASSVRGPRAAARRGRHLVEAGDLAGAVTSLLDGLDALDDGATVERRAILALLDRCLADRPADDPDRIRADLARLPLCTADEAQALGKRIARHGTTADRFAVAVHMVAVLREGPEEQQDTWVARAFALARKIGSPQATGRAWRGQASMKLSRGDLAGAERALAKAQALLDDPASEVVRAELLTTLGRGDEARALLSTVDPASDAVAARLQAAWGHAAFLRDDLGRALLHYRASEDLAERTGLPSDEPSWHVAKTLCMLHRPDEARERLDDLATGTGAPRTAAHVALLALDAERADTAAVFRHLEWLDDRGEPLAEPAVARLLDRAAALVDEPTADRVRALARRLGGMG